MILNVLIACEESQAECAAFRSLGHRAFSCDIVPCRKGGNPSWHILDDCRPYLKGRTKFTTQDGLKHSLRQWDLIIAHPPCTYLSKVGSRLLYKEPLEPCYIAGKVIMANRQRITQMHEAADFFRECLTANVHYLAVENPIPMKIAGLPRPSFYACQSWFGVKYTKKTCYRVRNLPPLVAQLEFPNPKSFTYCSRGKYRSRTFPQLAKAIAVQWSDFIILDRMKSRKKRNTNPQTT